MNRVFYFLFVSLLPIPLIAQSFSDFRYTNTLFPQTSVNHDVIYASDRPDLYTVTANELLTSNMDLKMDIYYPTNDDFNFRPAIVFAHGGGFIIGSKEAEDMVALCDSFARKGYVTASIQYRLGIDFTDGNSAVRAAYRGIQDGRSAIRFLRANAETYGIDPSKIYFMSNSAGSFIGLHSVYVNDEDEIPEEAEEYQKFLVGTVPSLGHYDLGDYLNEKGSPDALFEMWGALLDTALIDIEDNTPVFLCHGTSDLAVPIDEGSPFLGIAPNFPSTDGSQIISAKLQQLNMDHETYFVEGVGHEFYGVLNGNFNADLNPGPNEYWDTIIWKARDFFYNQHKPLADFNYIANNLQVQFTDLSVGALQWHWQFGDGMMSNEQDPSHVFSSEGSYTVHLTVLNENLSWDTITKLVTVNDIDVSILPLNKGRGGLFEIMQNPCRYTCQLNVPNLEEDLTLYIYNSSGQCVWSDSISSHTVILGKSILSEPGVYFCHLLSERGGQMQKLILLEP